MTARELITLLESFDPDLPVVLDHFENGHVDLGAALLVRREHPPHEQVVVLYEVAPVRPSL